MRSGRLIPFSPRPGELPVGKAVRRERLGVSRRCGAEIVQRPSKVADTGRTVVPRPLEVGDLGLPTVLGDIVAMCRSRRCR